MNSTASAPSPICQKALDHARRGWRIFPLKSIPAGSYPWELNEDAIDSAVALSGVSVAEATTHLGQVGRWWNKHPNAGIGLATGSVSGLLALVVHREAGRKALEGWIPSGERLPFTPQVKLPPDVSIYLFRTPGGQPITTTKLAGGMIAVMGEEDWVPLPPSVSDEGTCEWQVPPSNAPLAVAPAWLLDHIAPEQAALSLVNEVPLAMPMPARTSAIVSIAPPSPDLAKVPNKPQTASVQAAGPSSSTVLAGFDDIKLDDEFARLMPAQTIEERKQLEANLLTEGCRDPLVVWKETGVLLDGYNRFDVCKKHDIPYQVVVISLRDREAARRWIIDNQGGRRNLSLLATAYFLGKQYEAKKKPAGGTGANQHRRLIGSTEQSGNTCHSAKTADTVAGQHKLSPRSMLNYAQFARAVDQIAANCGEETRDLLLSTAAQMRQQDVVRLAKLNATQQRQAIQELARCGRWKRPAKARTNPMAKGKHRTQQAMRGSANTGLTVLPAADPRELADQLMGLLGPKKSAVLNQAMSKLLGSRRPDKRANSRETKGNAGGGAPMKTRPTAAGR